MDIKLAVVMCYARAFSAGITCRHCSSSSAIVRYISDSGWPDEWKVNKAGVSDDCGTAAGERGRDREGNVRISN